MGKKKASSEILSRDHSGALQTIVPPDTFWFWETDLRKNRMFCSAELNTFLGIEPDQQMTPEESMQYVHPEDRERVRAALQKPAEGVRQAQVVYRVVTASGVVRLVRARAQFLMDDQNQPVRVTGLVRDITESKQADDALRLSQASLENTQRLAGLGSWDWDLTSNRGHWSDELYRVFGMEPQETEANSDLFMGLVHPDDRDLITKAVEDALSGKKPYQVEHRLVRRDGEVRFLKEIAEVIRDENGTPVSMHGIMQDITDLKLAEDALRESERSLQRAHHIAKLAHWEFDLGSRRFKAYGDMYADFGLGDAETEFSFEDALAPVHPDDVARVRAAFERSFTQGVPYDETDRVVYDDGRTAHMHLIGEVIRDDTGAVVGMRGTTQDVTEQMQAQESLKRQEAQLRESQRRLLDAQRMADLGNWVFDVPTGRYSVLGEFFKPYDFPMEDEEATFSLEEGLAVVHPDDLEVYKRCLDRCLIDGTTFDVTVRSLTTEERTTYLHVLGEAIRDDSGAIVGMRGTTQDITGQKEADEALRRSEQQLQQAQKMETVGQLAAGVAHDFNNMLSVIMGGLELVQRRMRDDPQAERLLENALKASHRGAELTQSLLAFSRKQVLFPKTVDINKSAEGVLELAKRTVAKTVDIEFEPLSDLWAAEVDPAHLESAILNLVVNACAAMPDGGEVKVSTWNASQLDPAHRDDESWPTADYVCLAVADTGHGMKPEVLERAVEPFFTTKGMAQGSGLGLSMVYGFVEQSGGLFDIVSEPGVGTKVILSLPRSAAEIPGEGQQKPAGRRDENARTVLLVEDEPQVMETVAFQLSDLGFRVLVAADAEEALRLLGQNTGVDLLFTDVVLGLGKNGITLALEAQRKYPDLKVLCTSGYAGEEIRTRYEGAQDLQILAKPFTLDQLARSLEEVFPASAH